MATLAPGEHQQISSLATFGKTKKVRVLYVDTTRFMGPLMQVHGQVMRHLDLERYEVRLLADPSSGSTQRLRELPHLGIWVQPLAGMSDEEGRGWRWPRSLLNDVRILAELPKSAWKVWKHQVAVVHVGMTARMLAVGLLLSAVSRARLVVHAHEAPMPDTAFKRLLFKVCLSRADAVIAVSSFIKGKLAAAGVKSKKIVVVLNSVDLTRFHPGVSGDRIRREYGIAPDDVLVVCLGRYFPGKGQLYLAQAMGLVRREAPEVKALMIGWDDAAHTPGRRSYKEEVRQYCYKHGLDDTVILGAARPDAPEIMAAADIVAIPSTNDPCPLTVLEAMATGKPIVAFQSGGIPEEVGMGEGAILVKPGNVRDLAQAILGLALEPERRQKLGWRARRRAELSFYEQRLAEEVMQVYEKVLREKSPRTRKARLKGQDYQ